jgi:hypothetical protein
MPSSLIPAARIRLLLTVALSSSVCGLALAAPATAGVEHYCEGADLPAGWSCASTNAHTGAVYVDIQTNHTGCAGVALGYGGYNSAPTGDNTLAEACTNGAGTNGACVSTGSNGTHGAVMNFNSSTADFISEAHMTFPCP